MSFPASPTVGQTYTTAAGTSYIYTYQGVWQLSGSLQMSGATASVAGNGGIVPIPASAEEDFKLYGDATWDGTDRQAYVTLSNFTSSGSLGTAATTVDISSAILINQTTANINLTLSNPTASTKVKRIIIVNIGTTALILNGISISANSFWEFEWIPSTTSWVSLGNSNDTVTSLSISSTLSAWGQLVLISAASGNLTLQLPTAVGFVGKTIKVVRVDSTTNTLTISPNGSQTINGGSSYILGANYASATFESDGTNVEIIAETFQTQTLAYGYVRYDLQGNTAVSGGGQTISTTGTTNTTTIPSISNRLNFTTLTPIISDLSGITFNTNNQIVIPTTGRYSFIGSLDFQVETGDGSGRDLFFLIKNNTTILVANDSVTDSTSYDHETTLVYEGNFNAGDKLDIRIDGQEPIYIRGYSIVIDQKPSGLLVNANLLTPSSLGYMSVVILNGGGYTNSAANDWTTLQPTTARISLNTQTTYTQNSGAFIIGSNSITVLNAGTYFINANLSIYSSVSSGLTQGFQIVQISGSNTNIIAGDRTEQPGSSANVTAVSTTVNVVCNAGDTIDFRIFNNSYTNTDFWNGNITINQLPVGTSVVAPTSSTQAIFSGSGSIQSNATATAVGSFSGQSNVFALSSITVNKNTGFTVSGNELINYSDGTYDISLTFEDTSDAGNGAIYKNGNIILIYSQASNTDIKYPSITRCIVDCVVGDVLTFADSYGSTTSERNVNINVIQLTGTTSTPVLTGATSSSAGITGTAPFPPAGYQDAKLSGDATWDETDRLVGITLSLSSSGTIGTAATTVDVAGQINITATSAALTFTLPTPTASTKNRRVVITNSGTTNTFTVNTNLVPLNGALMFVWNPSLASPAWELIGSSTMIGATSSAAGIGGSVPAPIAGQQNNILLGNATWSLNTVINDTGTASFVNNNTVSGAANLYSTTTTGNMTIGNALTSGTIAIGGLAGTGNINLGSSSSSQTVNISSGTGISTTNIGIGNSSTINIGTSAGYNNTVSIGNTFGTTGVTLSAGSNGINIGGIGTVTPINIGVASTTSNIIVGTAQTTGVITIGGTAQTGTITLGNSSSAQTVNIANGTGAASVNIGNGSASTTNIGTGAFASTVSIGSSTGAATTNINAGTGGVIIGGTTSTPITLGHSVTTGNITIGQSLTTGQISIGNSSETGVIQTSHASTGSLVLGSGLTTGSITIGSTTTTGTITVGNSSMGGVIDLYASTVNISTGGFSSSTVNIGSGNTTAIAINGGTTGTITIGGNSGTGGTISIGGSNQTGGISTLHAGTGSLSLANGITTGTITFGSTLSSGTITIGNSSSTGTIGISQNSLGLNSTPAGTIYIGNSITTGSITIGESLSTGTLTIGNNSGTSALTIENGTGPIYTVHSASGSLVLGSGLTTGSITIGSTSTSGNITIGNTNMSGTIALEASIINLNARTGGTVYVGNNITTGVINIGQALTTGSLTIGSLNGTTTTSTINGSSIVINSTPTGTITIGNNFSTGSIAIGSGNATIHIYGTPVIGTMYSVTSLPTGSSVVAGSRCFVNNGVASPTLAAAVGSTTGSTTVPVYYDGSTWRYG